MISPQHNRLRDDSQFYTMRVVKCTTSRRANTQLSGAAISSTVFEIYAALAASAGAGVRKDRLHLPRFCSRIQVHFLFLPRH
jgi:hypothetical protein